LDGVVDVAELTPGLGGLLGGVKAELGGEDEEPEPALPLLPGDVETLVVGFVVSPLDPLLVGEVAGRLRIINAKKNATTKTGTITFSLLIAFDCQSTTMPLVAV
jgi:hypothetical protein